MNEQMPEYHNYSATDFMEDPFFILWVKGGDSQADHFWQQWMDAKPQNLEAAMDAKNALGVILSAAPIGSEPELKHQIWQRIDQDLSEQPILKVNRKPWVRWAGAAVAAACAVLIIGAGIWLIRGNLGDRPLPKQQQRVAAEILPRGNEAVLTLADGSKINLAGLKDGTTINSHGVKLVKLGDGSLSYDFAAGRSAIRNSRQPEYNTVTTPKGGTYQIRLSDGTKVWLNSGSMVRFPTSFTGDKRVVNLNGEAYFEVAHNKLKPFEVATKYLQVRVLGTHFNLDAYDNHAMVKATLLQGSVRVSAAGNSALLRPGQQASLMLDNNHSQLRVQQVDTLQAIAWKNGFFAFDDADIRTVMLQLCEWYDVEVVYKGPVPKAAFSGKVYRNMSLQNILEVLRFTNLNIELKGRLLVVSQK